MANNSLVPVEVNHQSVLLCANDDSHRSAKDGLIWTSSPIMCLSEATQNSYDAIILYIKGSSLVKAASMIELCSILKKNRHTCDYPVLAVCFYVNRQIIERLKEADVDFVVVKKDLEKIDPESKPAFLMNYVKEENRPARVLDRLCPYIHYAPINDDKELITCKAYANWLVLGPRRLQELCETPCYSNCPYYQSPKPPK